MIIVEETNYHKTNHRNIDSKLTLLKARTNITFTRQIHPAHFILQIKC